MPTDPQTGEATESLVDTSLTTQGIVLDTEQELAVQLCMDLEKRIVSVTGPAGTGKTTILKTTYKNYIESGYSVGLAAPTGKAAKRITELTGFPASTIHRLLEFTHPGEVDEKTGKPYGMSVPRRTRQRPLDLDVLFVDEYTMVNHELHRDIIDALKPGALLRCFGDINQLPPIESNKITAALPSPFKDILTRFPSVTLKKLHRQGEGSDIAVNANRILYGMCPVRKPDFELVITEDPVNKIRGIIADTDCDWQSPLCQVITPQNRSWIGSIALNGMMQPMFHDTMAGSLVVPRNKWDMKNPLHLRKTDKIIWSTNDYNLMIFNGELGIVKEIYDDGSIEVDFGDRIIIIPPVLVYFDRGEEKWYDPRKTIQLAYAITTHKSQGSEYEHVIYVLNKSVYMMLNRANFYTAVTRARKHVWLVTDASSMMTAASTTRSRI